MIEAHLIQEVSVSEIVSVKEIKEVISVEMMTEEFLIRLIKSVKLLNSNVEPYKESSIVQTHLDPTTLLIGQTFVEKEKLRKIKKNIAFLVNQSPRVTNFAELPPLIIKGFNSDGERVSSYYLPPIIEEHNGKSCIIDGNHRCYIANEMKIPINVILIKNAISPPCGFDTLDSVKITKRKPKSGKRLINGNLKLFRDFKDVGIDG